MTASMSIGELAELSGVPATTLRYYEDVGVLHPHSRDGGRRRYGPAEASRLEVISLCKAAGFTLDEIRVLYADDAPGRAASRAMAEAKLTAIDEQLQTLARARAIIEWGMRCTCPSIDTCTCGIHPPSAHR